MKKFNLVFGLVVVGLLMSSCVMLRGGANFASEKSKFDSPGFDSDLTDATKRLATTSTSSETGFYIGLAFQDEFLDLSEDFSIQPEVNFVAIKDLNQIQVPVLGRYNFAEGFNAYAGPNLSFLLDTPDGIKSFNFSLDAGLSYDISDDFLIEARYNYGLSNLLENAPSDFSVKLSNFQVGVAYRFGE